MNSKFHWLLFQDLLFNYSNSLLHIFLPLYLLEELNFPLWLALTPLLAAMVSYASLNFFGYKIQRKIGTKKFFIIHLILALVHSSFLLILPFHLWAFWVYLALSPLTGLFSIWQPYQIYLAKYTEKQLRGKQLSFISVTILIASALGVFSGSLILTYFGFVALILVKYVIMISRILPIMKMDNFFEPTIKWKFSEIIKLSCSKRFRKTALSQIVFGILSSGNLLWPIFIFVSLKSYISVGSVISIALLFQVVFTLFVGNLTDKFGRKRVLTAGTFFYSLSWFGKFIIAILPKSTLLFLGLETYTKLVKEATDISFQSAVYDKIDKNIEYRPLFDIMSHFGEVPSMLIVVLLLYFFPVLESYIFIYFLICAGIIHLLPLICNREK